jgi:hypothetical protein
MRPTTTPSASTWKSSSFHSPDGREAVALLRMSCGLIRRLGSRPAESRPAAVADCQGWKRCRTGMAYRPRRTRKRSGHSRGSHRATRKPKHGQSEYDHGASGKADTRTGDRPLQARLQPRLMWVSPPACCAPIFGLALQGPCVRVLDREPVPRAARRTAKPQALRRGARRF